MTRHIVISEHVITPPEAKTHHSTTKENKYTPIGIKTRVDVTPQNKKKSKQTNNEKL
jgi:hypothetical protein